MDIPAQVLPQHQIVLSRFVVACQADARIVAGFLGGSYVRGRADAYSDLDLGLITTDATFDDFIAQRDSFLHLLGDLVFVESFDRPNLVFVMLHDGTEVELAVGHAGHFQHMHSGPYHILVDKMGILSHTMFTGDEPTPTDRIETARRLVAWFWHDLSHFIAAMGRGHLWWAQGQLEELRCVCVNLARLRHQGAARADGYEKLEQAVPVEQLAALQATFGPLERGAMLQAARVIVQFYEEVAPVVAGTRGLAYPADLARIMRARLEKLL